MRVAISAVGATPTSQVDPRLGRAHYLMIYDTASDSWESIDNQKNIGAPGGAGIAVAEMLAQKHVTRVLTGACGPKALQALTAAKIQVEENVNGTVTEALRRFLTANRSTVDSAE